MRRAVAGFLFLLLPIALVARRSASAPREAPHGDLSIDCEQCHNPERWTPVEKTRFRHETVGLPLIGAHARLRCRSCHESLVFSHVGTACADCHKDAHRGELGSRCEDCHTTRSWSNRREMFAVHSRTRFPLLAAHASLDCDACHRGQAPTEYALTPIECESCHLETWNRTSNPNHAAVGFSTRCQDCHGWGPRAWEPVRDFPHPASFPLRGGHLGLPCSACHAGGYAALPRACVSCHEQDYLRASNPSHTAGVFPRRCEECHNDVSWRPATFDHSRTGFPLTGAHTSVSCEQCHVGGRYAGTPTRCYACHRDDYEGTRDPNHVAAHFPTRCEECHTTGAWTPASFDHDGRYFPIYSGRHRGVWSDCSDCHVNPGDYSVFECINCHTHNRSDTDRAHREVRGYSYSSQACYSCHPRGVGED